MNRSIDIYRLLCRCDEIWWLICGDMYRRRGDGSAAVKPMPVDAIVPLSIVADMPRGDIGPSKSVSGAGFEAMLYAMLPFP